MAFVQKTFWMNLPVSIKQTNCGGCLDIAHICFVFFLFYSTIMIFTLADQLQWPTKQLTVLQIVSKKVLWMSSTFRCESSTPRYPHGDFWSWLLGLPGFLRVTPFPGKYPSITAGRHCKVLQSRGDVKNGKTLVAAIIAPPSHSCYESQVAANSNFSILKAPWHFAITFYKLLKWMKAYTKKTSPATNQTK